MCFSLHTAQDRVPRTRRQQAQWAKDNRGKPNVDGAFRPARDTFLPGVSCRPSSANRVAGIPCLLALEQGQGKASLHHHQCPWRLPAGTKGWSKRWTRCERFLNVVPSPQKTRLFQRLAAPPELVGIHRDCRCRFA